MAKKKDSGTKIAGVTALAATTAIGLGVAINRCSGTNHTAANPSSNVAITGNPTSYFLAEIEKAASRRARGMLDTEKSDLYYQYADDISRIKKILKTQPTAIRVALNVRLNGRKNHLEEKHQEWEDMLKDIFVSSYANREEGIAAMEKAQAANPESFELIYNEILRSLEETVLDTRVVPSAEGKRGR
jgi:hypothetical protein